MVEKIGVKPVNDSISLEFTIVVEEEEKIVFVSSPPFVVTFDFSMDESFSVLVVIIEFELLISFVGVVILRGSNR